MPRIKICKEDGCHNAQTTAGYCRLHYLKHWKELKAIAAEKAAKKLNRYVDFMSKQNPERYIDNIKKDLRSKHFEPKNDEEGAEETEAIDKLFGADERAEIETILKELKIEKDF